MDPDSDSPSASRLHYSHNSRCCSLAGDLSVRCVKSEAGFPSHSGNSPTSSRTLRRVDRTQRLQAGIVTAALVSVGAYLGAPLSTTHVHAGSTAGIGGRKEVIVSALRGIVLPWLVTLPAAGLLAITVAILVARL